jgi:hypothetical protein
MWNRILFLKEKIPTLILFSSIKHQQCTVHSHQHPLVLELIIADLEKRVGDEKGAVPCWCLKLCTLRRYITTWTTLTNLSCSHYCDIREQDEG